MNLNLLNDKKIAILGLGIENLALVKYLLKHKVNCGITICDRRKNIKAIQKLPPRENIHWQLGKNFNKNLEKFNVLFRSPGWPINCPGIQAALKAGVELSSPMKLFFELSPTKNIIGVTGTKGKGTTADLIYEILRMAGKRVWLGGNIGVAPFEFIDKIRKNDWVVLELSSFQLEDMAVSPHIAVITNLYPEHLQSADPNNPNFHKTLNDYRRAKWNIVRWQKKNDYAIVNSKIKSQKSKLQFKSQKLYFFKSELPSKLIGEHNKENIAAAAEVAKLVGVKPETIKKAVAKFKGLEHRLEFVREVKGVKYYNDSFATTPESTIIALNAFRQPVIILLGGADKGSDFKELAGKVKQKVKYVVLLKGLATPRVKKELLKSGFSAGKMKSASNIKDAVKYAWRNSVSGDVVLLSTACASFGMFKNYKERGKLFKAELKKY